MKKKRGRFVLFCILVFLLSMGAGAASKVLIKPSWSKEYEVKAFDASVGTMVEDLAYGDGDAQKYDLYLPADTGKEHYGLAVYLHAGGFTSGDKIGDREMLQWLCSKGYVAAGINYTLFDEEHPDASVMSQSNEIKAAVPVVIAEAADRGYPIDKMTIAGGSAGHALAMIYAYRDRADSPVPVVFTFGAVGPSCFYKEDWDNYGLDRDTEESVQAAAGLFGTMLGEPVPEEKIRDGSYVEMMKPISAAAWITPDSPPTVVAYGTHDRVQPFKASLRLKAALEEQGVDHQYFELPHSGHGLQNDDKISRQWMEAIVSYLDKYMPVE